MATTAAGPVTTAGGPVSSSQPAAGAAGTARAADEPRYTVSVSCRVDGEAAQVSFTTFRRTLIQQIMDSSLAFFKISPSQSQTAQLVLGGKQVISFSAQSTVEDLKLTTPDRQSLELVLLDEEPEVTFPVRDQYGNEELLRARLYHPFVDAVRRLLDPDSPALQAQAPPPPPAATNTSSGGSNNQNNQQQAHGLDVDLYRSSDVSLISLQNSPAACGLQGGEPLLLYRYGRCSREYWQGLGQPDRGLKPTFAGLYISDYKNQFQGRAVFRHDLAMPLEYLLSTYCKWRGIDKDKASFLWLQFYMRLSLKDTGLGRGMDDGDTIYIFDKQDPQGKLWDGVLDGNVEAVKAALDEGASLEGPEGSFEAITSRWPLHAAAANNHLPVAEVLVERGADVDKLDAVSEPALWHAVEQGHGEMVALLLKLGATASDLPCPAGKQTKADYAALCHAAEKGSLSMVQLLLDKGANPYTYDDTGYCAYDYLVDQAKPLELLRALLNADSAFAATQKSYQQAYQRLCAAVKRAQRYPALGCNCRTCNSVVEVRAAEAEATQTLKAQIGCVALVRAVQAGGPHCLEAMQLLHAHGALLDGQDQDGRTALHQAIRYNRLAEAKWLVSAGAHLDVADFEGLLPLHQAACTGNVEFARLLVEAGAPINLHTVKYITQESLEAQTKKQEAGSGGRKAAKKRNALDVTGLTTIGGNSALALAVRHGHAAVVEYLLSQQASFDLKNPADSSAFHAALDRGAASVASKLLQHLNKPKPGKAMATGALVAPQTLAKVKSKDTSTKDKPSSRKAVAQIADGSCKVGAGGMTPGGAAVTATGQSTSDSDGGAGDSKGAGGDVSSPEPALAVDAGAGLREIVQAERERLRQEKGLGRASAADTSAAVGPGASQLKQAPSLMQQLEALKAAEKAAAAKAAAEQAAAAARAKEEGEKAAAEKARQEEMARQRAEEAAKVKEEEERRRKQEEEERKREDEQRRKEEDRRREEERKREEEKRKEEEQGRKEEEAAAVVAAAAAKAKADAECVSTKGGKGKAVGTLANGGVAVGMDTSPSVEALDADVADSAPVAKPGVQILFRSTSNITPPVSKQLFSASAPTGPQTPTATTTPASTTKTLRAGSLPSTTNTTSTTADKAAQLLSASTSTTANLATKKGKGKTGKAAAVDAEHAAPSPSSIPNTPSKHPAADHASTSHTKQTTGAAATTKRGTSSKVAAATPTAAALAASAALAHSTSSARSVGSSSSSSHQAPHTNGPSHHSTGFDCGYSSGYGDDHGLHHGGHSHNATPGLSPRHAAAVVSNSAATTPVRSSKPSSRRNSFSSGSLNTLQHNWPGQQQQQHQQQTSQSQHTLLQQAPPTPQQAPPHMSQDPASVLFSASVGAHPSTQSAGTLRMPPGMMVGNQGSSTPAGHVQGLGELGGPGLHMAPHHHLSPLRHSPPGPRVPASGTPTGPQDDPGLWDDAGHLESFVMSVVTDDGSGTPNGAQHQHMGRLTARSAPTGHMQAQQASGKHDSAGNGGVDSNASRLPPTGQSPFKMGTLQAGSAPAWGDISAPTAVHNAASGSSNGTPRAPPPGMPAPQRAATAPGLDRVASADVLAALTTHVHMPSDTGSSSRAGGAAGGQRLGGLTSADEQFAGWTQAGTASVGASGMDSSGWSQQQGGSQHGGSGTGGPPSWGSWMQSSAGADLLGGSNQKGATGSGDSAQQFLGGSVTGGGAGSSSGLGMGNASTLLVGAAPFVPGEQSHWQSRGGESNTGNMSRELDPLPHLPASLFEDDTDVPPPQMDQPRQAQPTQQTQQQQTSGRLQSASASNSSSQQSLGGPHMGGGQQGSGQPQGSSGAQGGRNTPGAGGGGMPGAGRPSSRGRPSAGMHTRTGSAGNSQDGSAPLTGRYPGPGANTRMPSMNTYGGPGGSGVPQPSLPGLYNNNNNNKQEAAWYSTQQANSWQQSHGQGYSQGIPGVQGVQGSQQHGLSVSAAHVTPHAAFTPSPAAAMYQALTSMNVGGATGGLGGAAGWGDAAAVAAAAAAAAGGPPVNGYWPAVGRGPPGISDLMGGGPRGRPLAPSQGQPPRYRQH